MNKDFEQFAKGLSTEERGTLLSAVPLLTALVARADGKLTLREKIARWRSYAATKSSLDSSFVSADAALVIERHLERLGIGAPSSARGTSQISKELRRLRAVIRKMPSALEGRFETFLLEACLGVATASGGFLFFGEEISPAERDMLRLIVRELELHVSDPSIRASLELD